MANTRNRTQSEHESQSSTEQQGREGQQQRQLQRDQTPAGRQQMAPYRSAAPFQWMRQMSEDMDRMFDRFFGDIGFPRRGSGMSLSRGLGEMTWRPKVEAYQKDDKFIIRAELPGVSRDDVTVDISDEAVTIRGERKQEQEEEREGFYHSEWSYGSFARTVPLPEGAIGDNAEATFRDGVLKVTIPAPPSGVRQGRRIEIQEERGSK